ncbi:hypothetical protein IOD13_00450 [Brevibacterium casei]|nr:hypothetical protein [Brevibacterium casei]
MRDGDRRAGAPRTSALGQAGPLGSRPAAVIAPNTTGWLARFLLWAGIFIGFLPAVLLVPILMSADFEEVRRLHSLVTVFTGILSLLLAAAAFALIRNTSWARRLIGGGLFVFAEILGLTVPPALVAVVAEISYQFNAGLWVSTVVFAVFSAFTLTLRLVGWSIARNRRWWVLLVAAGRGVVIPVISASLQSATSTTLDRPGLPYWVGGVIVPIISAASRLRCARAPSHPRRTPRRSGSRRRPTDARRRTAAPRASSTALAPYPGGAPGQGPLGQGPGHDANGQQSSGQLRPGQVPYGGQRPMARPPTEVNRHTASSRLAAVSVDRRVGPSRTLGLIRTGRPMTRGNRRTVDLARQGTHSGGSRGRRISGRARQVSDRTPQTSSLRTAPGTDTGRPAPRRRGLRPTCRRRRRQSRRSRPAGAR